VPARSQGNGAIGSLPCPAITPPPPPGPEIGGMTLSVQGTTVRGTTSDPWSASAWRRDAPRAPQQNASSGGTATPSGGEMVADEQTMSTKWKSGGFDCEVKTPRKGSESAVNQAKRHKEAVDAFLAVFPKDGIPHDNCTSSAPPWSQFSVVWASGTSGSGTSCNEVWASAQVGENAYQFAQRCADATDALKFYFP